MITRGRMCTLHIFSRPCFLYVCYVLIVLSVCCWCFCSFLHILHALHASVIADSPKRRPILSLSLAFSVCVFFPLHDFSLHVKDEMTQMKSIAVLD